MWNWLRELYDIRLDYVQGKVNLKRQESENQVCQACEVLKVELSRVRHEKDQLLNRVLNPVAAEEPETVFTNPAPIMSRHMPWKVKQQELEAKDRQEHARIMKQFEERNKAAVDTKATESVAKLERELGITDAG